MNKAILAREKIKGNFFELSQILYLGKTKYGYLFEVYHRDGLVDLVEYRFSNYGKDFINFLKRENQLNVPE